MQVTFISASGAVREVDAQEGMTLMEAAVRNGVAGIEAECGGACACATCHVYVDPAFAGLMDKPGATETDMLDFASDVRPESRLSCQIPLRAALAGLVVRLPARQG